MKDLPKTTAYFREQVLVKRPYLKVPWCAAVLGNFLEREVEADGRIRFWAELRNFQARF